MKKRIISLSVDEEVYSWFKAKYRNISKIVGNLMRQHMHGYSGEKYDFQTLINVYEFGYDDFLRYDPVLFAKLYIASGDYEQDIIFKGDSQNILVLDDGVEPYFNFDFFRRIFCWALPTVTFIDLYNSDLDSFLKRKLLNLDDDRPVVWNLHNHEIYDKCVDGLRDLLKHEILVQDRESGLIKKRYKPDRSILPKILRFLDVIRSEVVFINNTRREGG